MTKSISCILAAFIAAGVSALPSLSAQVQARAPVLGAKGDRIDARPIGTACSHRAWPYFEAGCLRDTRNPFGEVHPVRMVSTDRLP
jgi:hypothetical protein